MAAANSGVLQKCPFAVSAAAKLTQILQWEIWELPEKSEFLNWLDISIIELIELEDIFIHKLNGDIAIILEAATRSVFIKC